MKANANNALANVYIYVINLPFAEDGFVLRSLPPPDY